MKAKHGLTGQLVAQINKVEIMTVDAAHAFLKSANGGVQGGSSSTISQLVCEDKLFRRAKSPNGDVFIYKKGVKLPEGFDDLGHNKLKVRGNGTPKIKVSEDDDYLICIRWKDNETLSFTPAEAESLWNKLSHALKKV